MAFYEKFKFDFRNNTNEVYTAIIYDQVYRTGGTTIIADVSPVIVDFPTIDTKYTPVRGSGIELNLISSTNMQYLDLYTTDMQGCKVKVLKGSLIVYLGYLDSELYHEPFDDSTNYPVQFTGNDGLALLNRFSFLNASGGTFSGIIPAWDIIKYILLKINLEWVSIYTSLATTISGVTLASNENLFEKVYINCDNFYDEDGVPQNLRDVLESILKPFCATLCISNGNVWITDLTSLYNCSALTCQRYIINAGYIQYFATQTKSLQLGDISTIGTYSSGANLNIVNAINEQVVEFSPFAQNELINIEADNDFSTVPTSYYDWGTTPYKWREYRYATSSSFNKFGDGDFASYKGLEGDNISESDYYLRINNSGLLGKSTANQGGVDDGDISFTYKKKLPHLIPNREYKLKIEMKIYLQNVFDLGNSAFLGEDIRTACLQTRLKIGNKKVSSWYQWGDIQWVNLSVDKDMLLFFEDRQSVIDPETYNGIQNTWVDLNQISLYSNNNNVVRKDYLIDLNEDNLNDGEIEFSIYKYYVFNMNGLEIQAYSCRIKDIKISVVDKFGSDIENNDIEYRGLFDKKVKESGESVSLVSGTNINSLPTSRGGLIGLSGTSYYWLQNFTRAGVSAPVEKLVLRTIQANSENRTIELSAKLNQLTQSIGTVTYSNYFSGKVFMVTGIKNNLADSSSDVVFQEIQDETPTVII